MYEANPRITTTAPRIIDALVVQDTVQAMVGDCTSKCSLQGLNCLCARCNPAKLYVKEVFIVKNKAAVP